MEEQWYAERCRLRELQQAHPAWTKRQLALELGRSLGWVKKWCRRLARAGTELEAVLRGQSRARQHPPPPLEPAVVERILAIRDAPPANLHRVPGPRAIRYYLQQDVALAAVGARLPRSTRTVWRILRQHGRIAQAVPRIHEPVDRPPPRTHWQLDFKDVTTVPATAEEKRQHVVEVLNAVDVGTSILVDARVRADFTAETALAAVVAIFRDHGLPERVTFDRDPRFVGSASGRDFPSPFLQLLAGLGIEAAVCPPHRPDKNAFVERSHRTFERECVRVERPGTREAAITATADFLRHDNEERPNQALSCGNRPPRVAFPARPARPARPERVDPDRWLQLVDGRRFVRKVGHNGNVRGEDRSYYVGTGLVGQAVVLQVHAAERVLVVQHRQREVKRLPLKGLHGAPRSLPEYLTRLEHQARARRLARPRPAPAAWAA